MPCTEGVGFPIQVEKVVSSMDSGIVANEVVARLFKTARCRAAIPVNEFATDFPPSCDAGLRGVNRHLVLSL